MMKLRILEAAGDDEVEEVEEEEEVVEEEELIHPGAKGSARRRQRLDQTESGNCVCVDFVKEVESFSAGFFYWPPDNLISFHFYHFYLILLTVVWIVSFPISLISPIQSSSLTMNLKPCPRSSWRAELARRKAFAGGLCAQSRPRQCWYAQLTDAMVSWFYLKLDNHWQVKLCLKCEFLSEKSF